jgi:hypothetical protein
MDKPAILSTLRADQRVARSTLAGRALDLADAKRALDKATREYDLLHAQIRNRSHDIAPGGLPNAIMAKKKAMDDAFVAWCDASKAHDVAMEYCCQVAVRIREAKG